MVDLVAQSEIDRQIAQAIAAWEELPRVEREIDGWDWEEQVAFIHEWAVQEDCLTRLGRRASHDAMTPEQHQRYDELLTLVARNRPIVERLRAI